MEPHRPYDTLLSFGFECEFDYEAQSGRIVWVNQALGDSREELRNMKVDTLYFRRTMTLYIIEAAILFAPRIIEIFSHPHCRKNAEAWGLSELEGKYRSESEISARLKFKYTKKYHRDWECILNIVWTISTYPEMYEWRFELDGYETYKDSIEELLSIVQSIDTMINTPQGVFTCMEAVVEKLVSSGMPRIKDQYPF